MALHFEREFGKLQERILQLCGAAEKSVAQSLHALEQQDEEAARRVIADDNIIDEMEVRIEEECLKILALHQPVAVDLRRVVVIMKINNDLERIGDYAVNIAKRQIELSGRPDYPADFHFGVMMQEVNAQLRRSVDALIKLDSELAREVIKADKVIDRMDKDMVKRAEGMMQQDAALVPMMLQIFSVSRSLERIGDHAVNIAEDVMYLISGEIVRHDHKALKKQGANAVPPPPPIA